MWKRYTDEMKTRIVLGILKKKRPLNELSSEHGIHVSQLRQWKKRAFERMPSVELAIKPQVEILDLNRSVTTS